MYEREKFCRSCKVKFEGRTVKITADYDNYLRILYGDSYMQVPPPEKREQHVMMELDIDALKRFAEGK